MQILNETLFEIHKKQHDNNSKTKIRHPKFDCFIMSADFAAATLLLLIKIKLSDQHKCV